MSSGPKIIIKPRQSARFAANASKRAPSARTESPDESAMEVDVVADDAQSGDASPHASSSTQQGPDAPPTGEADGDGSEVADGDYTEDVEEPPPEPEERPKRGRGRPRGSGTPRPRGRPRGSGRGRGRGRGRAITIRLPGRTNEESGGGADGDGTEGEEGVATPASGDDTALGKQIRKVNGRTYVIEGDELQIDDDPKGDTKIDKWGNLLEGEYN
jgi:chromatin structure-remodeling complex protein RSC7